MSIGPVAPVGAGGSAGRISTGDERRLPAKAEQEAPQAGAKQDAGDRIELSSGARQLRAEEPRLRLSTPELSRLVTPERRERPEPEERRPAKAERHDPREAAAARQAEQRLADRRTADAAAQERTAGRTPAPTPQSGIKPAGGPSDTVKTS